MLCTNHLFLNGEEIKNLVIPDGVTTINSRVFFGHSFASVTIPGSVESIKEKALGGSELKVVICYRSEPPTASLDKYVIEDATLYVPLPSLELYKSSYPWSDFGQILGLQCLYPIESEKVWNTTNLNGENLTDNITDNVYYNFCTEGYDVTDGSIVIDKPTNMRAINDIIPGSEDIKNNFTGLILKVAAGVGVIKIITVR